MEPLDFSMTKAIFFDFMGTCLDWHTSIINALPQKIPNDVRSELAISWREAFFEDIHERFEQGLALEDIDITHARLLKELLSQSNYVKVDLNIEEEKDAVNAWHCMKPWPDVAAALKRLRSRYEVFVLANGTTRLQLDLVRSSGLNFDMLFSSQLFELTKPELKFYQKGLDLVGVKPEECVMVAAHAYDLRAAAKVGMRTVYIQRWTEDTRESMEQIKQDVDLFIDGTTGVQECGLYELAKVMMGT